MPLPTTTFLTGLAALAAVLGLVLLLARLLRRSGLVPAAGRARRLASEDTLALDGRRRLHLVRCEGRQVLLLTGGASDVVVGWVDAAPALQPSGSVP